MTTTGITNSLSQNRAEEFGFDLYDEFIIPPNFDTLDLKSSAKPKVFIGGRGCGKTMLLRYLSHQSSFSKSKKDILDKDFEHIGLYWKSDTQIAHQLQKRGVEVENWHTAFEHFAILNLAIEAIKSIESIAESNFSKFTMEDLKKLEIPEMSVFGKDMPLCLPEIKDNLKTKLVEFQIWLSNIRKKDEPDFMPKVFLEKLVEGLRANIAFLKNSTFFIFIDEYENLLEFQQTIVNTWVKHSEKPIIYHLAMKRNAFVNKGTIGNEKLANIHDFRYFDLEEAFEDHKRFSVFAGEILLFRLYKQKVGDISIDEALIKDPSRLNERLEQNYQSQILGIVQKMFPAYTHKELAEQIFKEGRLQTRLIDKLQKALDSRKSKIPPSEFIYEQDLRVTLVTIPLLYRKRNTPEGLLEEINLLRANKDNCFFGKTEWVDNNFVGAYLLFYSGLPRACPFYSGYRTFCELSNGNIRHLMELCYKAFLRASDKNSSDRIVEVWNVDQNHQAQAAKQASSTFLNEIKTFGRYGNQLHTFVLRLGMLFNTAHRRPTQSEPEQNHFTISAGDVALPEIANDFLMEATKWSVLIENKATKKKSTNDADIIDYVLNPIYSPYFIISYRKMRRIELTSGDFLGILTGTYEEYSALLKKYNDAWGVVNDSEDEIPNLFSDLK